MTPVEQARQERLKQLKDGGSVQRVNPVEQARLERAKARAKEEGKPKLSPIEQARQERMKALGEKQPESQIQEPVRPISQPQEKGLGKILLEEAILKPPQVFPAAVAQKAGLISPGPKKLFGIDEPVKLPQTGLGIAGAGIDFGLTVGGLVFPELLAPKAARLAKAAKTADKALEVGKTFGAAEKAAGIGQTVIRDAATAVQFPKPITTLAKKAEESTRAGAMKKFVAELEKDAGRLAEHEAGQALAGPGQLALPLKGTASVTNAADKAVKVASKTRFFSDIAHNAKLGGAFGLGQGLQNEEGTLKERVGAVGTGALFGAAIPVAGKVASLPFKAAYNSKLVQAIKKTSLYQHFLGESRKVLSSLGNYGKILGDLIYETRNEAELFGAKRFKPLYNTWKALKPKDRETLVDLIKGSSDPAINAKLVEFLKTNKGASAAYQEWTRVAGDAARNAQRLGLKVRRPVWKTDEMGVKTLDYEDFDFVPRKNYFPEMIDTTKLTKSGLSKALDHLVSSGQAPNAAKAKEMLDSYMQTYRQRRAGSLEHSRFFDLPEEFYIKDPLIRMHDYVHDSWRRFAEIEVFGKEDKKIYDILSQIREESGDEAFDVAEKIYKRVFGKDAEFEPEFLRQARLLQMFSLGLAPISNAFQSINTVVKAGLKNTMRGGVDWLTRHGKDFALEAAAITESTARDLAPELAGGNFEKGVKALFKYTGFNLTERWNRGIAANAGKHYAFDLAKRLVKDPANPKIRAALREMGLEYFGDEAYSILKNPIKDITDPRLLRAGQRMSNLTQHRSSPLDLPLAWSSKYGKFITQFKNFPFKQAQFISDNVFKEAANGNFRPLVRFAVLGTMVGEVAADVKAFARGDTRRWDTEGLKRVVDNLAAIGSVGMFTDMINSASSGQMSMLKALAGPTVGDVAEASAGIAKAIAPAGPETEDKARDLKKWLTGQIPVIGPAIKNTLYPPTR